MSLTDEPFHKETLRPAYAALPATRYTRDTLFGPKELSVMLG